MAWRGAPERLTKRDTAIDWQQPSLWFCCASATPRDFVTFDEEVRQVVPAR